MVEPGSLKELILQRANRRQMLKGAMAAGMATPFVTRLAGAQEGTPAGAEGMPPPVDVGSFEGQTVNFMIIQPHAVTGDILKEQFEAATGATVNLTVVPYDEVQARATLDVQSGANEFDVIDYWYPTIGALSTQGIIEDITEWIDTDPDIDPADFIPSIYDVYTLFEGRRWGLPYDGDTHVLFYNTSIFEELGLSAPQTWDDFQTAAQTITEAGLTTAGGQTVYGFALQGFKAPIIIGSSYSNRLAGFGGSYLTPEGAPALDSEAAVQAAQAMIDAAPYALPTPLETAFDQALPAFLSGQIAMMEFWTDLGVYAQDPEGSQIVDQWDVVQMPYGGANTTNIAPLNAGFCFAVSTGSQNKDAARAFVKYATSKNFHLQMLTTTGSGIDPMRLSGLNSPLYIEFAPKVQAAAAASLNGAFPWPTIPESPELMTVLSDELALMLQGTQSAEDTMANVQEAWTQILG
jgi:multiple sugar transport system substrate-binding protein